MISYLNLESSKYWIDSEKQRQDAVRRARARKSTQQLVSFVVFATCVTILAVAFAWGVFENVDVPGTIERIWK